jgi:hypothetical protein
MSRQSHRLAYEGGETREQLLAAATAAGVAVSQAQIARWHRAGLLPRPLVRSLGRGRGTVSLYPLGTGQRLVQVAQLRQGERRLTWVAWRLWWDDGGALPEPARQLLAQVAQRWEQHRTHLAEFLAREEAGEAAATDEMDAIYHQAETRQLDRQLGHVRRNVGRKRFSTVMRVFAEIGVGRFQGYERGASASEKDSETGALVERAMGLDRARSDRLADAGPWLDGDSEVDFVRLSQALNTWPLAAGASANDEELNQARAELRAFLAVITTMAPLFERLFGRAAFGFGTITRILDLQAPDLQAFMLLAWLALRHDEALRDGMRSLGSLVPTARATAQIAELLEALGREVPAFGPVLTAERLAAAQQDAGEGERLRAEIARVREEHLAAVDAFFAAHPEANELLALIEPSDLDQDHG